MKTGHERCLTLNADYTAIGVVDWEDAITAEFKGTVQVVKFYRDEAIRCSSGIEWPLPAVIALRQYKRQDRRKIPFSRKNVFIRDKLRCQYCNVRFTPKELTFDHVVPRSRWDSNKRGTPTKWENIVTCCYPCNGLKGDTPLEKSRLQLKRQPHQPRPHDFVLGLAPWNKLQPEWVEFLPPLYKELCEIETYA